METKTAHFGDCDRYLFDFDVCSASKGWAQLDTAQDAAWFGNWLNPMTRQLVSYTEGDVVIRTCDDDREFVTIVRETFDWFAKNDGKRPGIDTMCRAEITDAFHRLGLAGLLH